MSLRRLVLVPLALLVLAVVASCSPGSTSDPASTTKSARSGTEMFPDVEKVAVSGQPGSLVFDVTMTSPYDTADRYADSMRVRSVDGEIVYGERKLDHDHADEQPFTRSIEGVDVPDGVTEVVVEGHDQISGWGGATQKVTIKR